MLKTQEREEGETSPGAEHQFMPGCSVWLERLLGNRLAVRQGGKGRWKVKRHQGLGTTGHAETRLGQLSAPSTDGEGEGMGEFAALWPGSQ